MIFNITLLTTLSAVALITGCATADSYRNTPTSKICVDYLTLPSININHGARAEELSRRGENCNEYMGIAKSRRDADNAFQNSMRTLQQSSQPQQIRTPVQTQCYRNGSYVNCTSY